MNQSSAEGTTMFIGKASKLGTSNFGNIKLNLKDKEDH